MINGFPTKEIEIEDAKLAALWVDSDDSITTIVEKYASDAYKKYYKKEKERQKRLWEEKGIRE